MKKPFKLLGYLSYIACILIVAIGLSTFTFEKTTGYLTLKQIQLIKMTGPYSGIPYVDKGPHYIPQWFVTYQYEVDGVIHKNNRIGMGASHWTLAPFWKMEWEKKASKSKEISVYYLSGYPEVAILYQGIDILLTLFFALAGFTLVYFSNWMHK
ncbi:MAG: hypothetical protein L3J46_01965 [Kangiellaceae bacterium]|nr:hypothetical protein [Kangiellaceae bacterium]